jgi:hypothetical protein
MSHAFASPLSNRETDDASPQVHSDPTGATIYFELPIASSITTACPSHGVPQSLYVRVFIAQTVDTLDGESLLDVIWTSGSAERRDIPSTHQLHHHTDQGG